MAIKNFSKKSIIEKSYDDRNHASSHSHDPLKRKTDTPHDEEWKKFISFYRQYPDKFAIEVLGLNIHLFQRVILRAMARHQHVMLICCRGLGKSWISAVFFVISCILYDGLKCGIASGKGQQARNVIIQKIKGELDKNPAIAREIVNIKTGSDDCVVEFRNGSEVRAIVLGIDGANARSWRFHYLLIDEAILVSDHVIEEVLVPMTKTKRPLAMYHKKEEKGKVIFISSAYLKTNPLYNRFKTFYDAMKAGDPNYFVACLDYRIGAENGMFNLSDIEQERDKPSMTKEQFMYEYEGIFVGSSGDSYYPYELTEPCRSITKCELQQPKRSKSDYIISHDVATSKSSTADNAVTHVIKLKQRADGTYYKEIVFTQIHRGTTLNQQRDFLRELYHLRFPNTIKIVIDMRGNGEHLPLLFYETWEGIHINSKGHQEVIEFPPLVLDDDKEALDEMNGSVGLIRGTMATTSSNNTDYTYMKACFENNSLRLLKPSVEMDSDYKNEDISEEEFVCFKQADELVKELSNIRQSETSSMNVVYERIDNGTKRDRAVSLMYGLSIVNEMESHNIKNKDKRSINYMDYFKTGWVGNGVRAFGAK